jgi:predicted transposase YbfD/YdcC
LPKKTFECAEQAKSILITQVKDNQKSLKNQLIHGCRQQKSVHQFQEQMEKTHGRLEQRGYEVFDALPMLQKWQNDWPHIRHIIRVTRFREQIGKNNPTVSVHYYVTNGTLTAQNYAKHIREHWFIENKLHHIKDAVFQEDTRTKHKNPFIYSMCIDLALNLMRKKRIKNIKKAIYQNSLEFYQFYKKFQNEFF